jgi:hypothetical protein
MALGGLFINAMWLDFLSLYFLSLVQAQNIPENA